MEAVEPQEKENATYLKVADSIPHNIIGFSIYLILPTAHSPGVDSASNRNEYQESSLGVKDGWSVRLTTSPPNVS
jgi:hypothetical protein